MDAETLMQHAISAARKGISEGQTPFGCAIYLNGTLIAADHNCVHASTDITAHAEITALRSACKSSGKTDLSGAIVATTCEPCPMCAAALHWARVSEIHFGASIEDAARAGFNELAMPADELLARSANRPVIRGGVSREACKALFDEWLARSDHQGY